MKLVLVFVLAAIPICCYASSSNCHAMDNLIEKITNSSVSVADFQKVIKSYALLPYLEKDLAVVKQCYLDQSEETLANYRVMMDAIYDSKDCPQTA